MFVGCGREGQWSRGMIPASGAGGREFDSLLTPYFFSWPLDGHQMSIGKRASDALLKKGI